MTFRNEQIGDKGQRYEIWAKDDENKDFRVGWSNTADGFKSAVELHPSWHGHRAVDRYADKPKITHRGIFIERQLQGDSVYLYICHTGIDKFLPDLYDSQDKAIAAVDVKLDSERVACRKS